MKLIKLYGELGQKFGREFHLDVKSPAEAIRALCAVVPGFEKYLYEHAKDYYKVFVGGRNACDEIKNPCSDKEVIRIAPVIQGASAVGRIVVGAILIALSFTPLGPALGATGLAMLQGMGASLVLGGVVELLTPVQKASKSADSSDSVASYNFNGPVNTTAQGNPVPLVYGEMIIGSAVISAGLTT